MQQENTDNKQKQKLTIEKLEKEDQQVQKIFDKLENRTNTFLSISLGIFSLQVTLLTNTIFNIFHNYTIRENIITIILILFITNITLNINAILYFRRSSKISENVYSPETILNNFIYENITENKYLKEEFYNRHSHILKNKNKLTRKKEYINKGLNNIITSMILLISAIIMLFLTI